MLHAPRHDEKVTFPQLNLRIFTLLGMSQVGKTTLARLLEAAGWTRFSIDDQIMKELGLDDMVDLARYMGKPWEPQYPDNSKFYLDLESALTRIFLDIAMRSTTPVVLDLTGSAPELGEHVMQVLRSETTLIHLQLNDQGKAHLEANFQTDPRPLYWGDQFKPKPAEDNEVALQRCFPALIEYRTALYKQWARIGISYDVHRGFKTGGAFVEWVTECVAATD